MNKNADKIRMIKRTCVIIGILAVFTGIFFAGKAFFSPAKGVAKVEQTLQLATELPVQGLGKSAPQEYNGQVRKVAYLTFDDGPSKLLPKFLEVLKKHDAKGTFFFVGGNLAKKDLAPYVKQTVEEGHYAGAHSMTHKYGKLYNQNEFVDEMKEALKMIDEITGKNPKLVRPPYGSTPGLHEQLRNETAEAGIKVWDWTIDSNDWRLKGNPQGIVEQVMKGADENVEVILLHEHQQSLDALEPIIIQLKEKGYELVAYDEKAHFPVNFWKDERL
ncbi:polysaccharide deacetylase [Priestia taiwanensis]|uniref:Polysaccharide deacetylase n=2 Tax=Priestia taiwanensis TaxID=1347902 RepID=A0A917EPL4_9BACI|nr:polysaccharide deacetylase [Priestia taiwanensis]